MRTFVINLDKNADRLATLGARLKEFGVAYEHFSAVYGKGLDRETLAREYDDKKAVRLNGRSLLLGEIGCALSHIGIYRKMATECIPYALVLEDDAYPLPTLPSVLEAVEEKVSAQEPAVVLLGEGKGVRDGTNERIFLDYSVYALDRFLSALRTHAYVVTLAAAERLAAHLSPVVVPADDWGRMVKYGVVKLYAVDPLVVGLDCSFGTTISNWGAPPARRTFFRKWFRRAWRLWWIWVDSLLAWRSRRSLS